MNLSAKPGLALGHLYSLIATFVLSTFLFSAQSFAETYYVRPTVGTGMAKEEIDSVHELLVMGVREVEGAQLTTDEAKADAVLEGKVVKLGSAYVLGLSKIRDGKVAFQSQARSSSLEDMDTVARRVARAIVNEKKFESDTRVTDVTEDQVTRGTRRTQATRQWTLGFGPGTTTNLNTSNSATAWMIGYNWGVSPNVDLKLGAQWVDVRDVDSGSTFDASIGLNYHLMQTDISPFVGVDFGWGKATAYDPTPGLFGLSDDTSSGFIAAVGAGVKFFRTSTVNLSLGARHVFFFDSTSKGTPSVTTGIVALHF